MEQLAAHWTDFHEILYLIIFRNYQENSNFIIIWQELRVLYTKTSLHFWSYLVSLSRIILHRMRNISDKIVEKIGKHILLFNNFFLNRAVYEVVWKSIVEPDRSQMTIWYMRTAFLILKAKTHTQNMLYLFTTVAASNLLNFQRSVVSFTRMGEVLCQ
jgi:hypothetical protein